MENLAALEFRNSRRLGVVATAISIAVLMLGFLDEDPSKYLLLWLGSVGVIAGLWLLLDRRVKLRLDEIGIRYSRWGIRAMSSGSRSNRSKRGHSEEWNKSASV